MTTPDTDMYTLTFLGETRIQGRLLHCPECKATEDITLLAAPGPAAAARECPNGHRTSIPLITGWDVKAMVEEGWRCTAANGGAVVRLDVPMERADEISRGVGPL